MSKTKAKPRTDSAPRSAVVGHADRPRAKRLAPAARLQLNQDAQQFLAALERLPPAAYRWLGAMMRCLTLCDCDDAMIREIGRQLAKACGHKDPVPFGEKAVQILRDAREARQLEHEPEVIRLPRKGRTA